MIVSHKYKFIFIHCRKVAGSSIKVALAPHLGEDDIVIGSMNEILQAGIKMNRAARRTLCRPLPLLHAAAARISGRTWPESANIGIKSFYRPKLSVNPPHPTASEIASYFAREWETYFKFAFVRNPFERTVSDYMWRRRSTGIEIPFLQFLRQLEQKTTNGSFVHRGGAQNFDMITLDGKIAVDMIGKFENLESDFNRVTRQAGIEGAVLGTRQKPGATKLDLKKFYGPEEIDIVTRLYEPELNAFGYDLPSAI